MITANPREDRVVTAIILMLVTFLFFSSMDTIAKILVTSDIPAMQVAFTRYFSHFAIVFVVYFPRHGRNVFRSRSPKIQTLRAIALLGSTVFNFAALAYLPLTVTTAIFFASPLAVCLLSIPILNEHVGIRRLTAVFVGFIGVVVITQAWNANFHWAMFMSLAAFLSASTYFVLTRKIAGIDNNPVTQIYASGFATIVLAPVAFFVWTMPSSMLEWVLLFVIGILGAVGHSLLTLAHRFAQASTLAPLVYVQIIYITTFSWVFFNTAPDFWTIVGTGIIVASGLYIWLRESRAPA